MTAEPNSPRRVLVLGSGAREHALARAMARSQTVAEIVVAPGNGGTSGDKLRSRAVDLADLAAVVRLAKDERADLVVVGPEAPLCAGAVDALEAEKILAFGPSKAAARLEGSKAFLKEFATRHGIPTAGYRIVTTMPEAEAAIRERGAPVVVKASGLCAGKGVTVASSVDEALDAARSMLVEGVFGEAGATVVIEECLVGREISLHAISDGERFVVLPAARDHKRIFDGDLGPNTGGMGVVCPAPDVTPELLARASREIIEPTLRGMHAEGHPFRGVLFAGLMVTPDGAPILLEHNVRFGDPECEAMMALLEGDVAELLCSAARGTLDPVLFRAAADQHAVVVVLAAHAYPATPRLGDLIEGIDAAEREEGVVIHHAGTKRTDRGLVTAGGRVLAVTATGPSFGIARGRAYAACDLVQFEGKQLRRDIGEVR